eukprot:Hpha_TRINITY_DN16911_c4_g4::TRINITY_DN16911_c4_g4_i1::g.52381::m.52381/K17086/TM9SF2_4; transmembrane 9 superfamily member 2/4
MLRAAALAAVLVGCAAERGFYLPGMEQRDYGMGDPVGPIDVNSLTSIHGIVPYPYYSLKLPAPTKAERDMRISEERLGEVLWGDRIEASAYKAEMMVTFKCRPVQATAESKTMSLSDLRLFEKRINNGYRGNLILDNLPVVSNTTWVANRQCKSGKEIYDLQLRGFPLGVSAACLRDASAREGMCHINNHLSFTIQTNEIQKGRFIIVGFYVVPSSVDHVDEAACDQSFDIKGNHPPVTTELPDGMDKKKIIWSYSVRWELKPDIFWASRWDAYLNSSFANSNARVHWLSIINSLLIALCLSAIVAMIMMRTLHMDFNRYNNPENDDEAQEEVGWKLVHADVFRPPSYDTVFCSVIGTGVQLMGMVCTSLFFALLGFLSPANRGALLTAIILLFCLMAIFNGFVTGLLQNMFHIKSWKWIFVSALAYPALVFLMWGVTSCFLAHKQAANAVPIATVLAVTGLWFCVSVPLVVLGAAFGFRSPTIEPPVKVQRLSRQIPPQRPYMSTLVMGTIPGIIPFGAAFIELRFILSSIWQGMVYYVFGFLSLVFGVMVITTVLTTIVCIYYQLVFEDHRWWWRSVIIPFGTGVHFFLYCIYYLVTVLHVRTWLGFAIFFQFSVVVSLTTALVLASIGFFGSFLFVRKIYSSVKLE